MTDTIDDETPQGPYTRPFVEFLQEQRKGALHAEVSDALQTLISAVRETGKTGKVTLVLTVKAATDDGAMVSVIDDVRITAPMPDRSAALYYVDDDNNLSRHDPNQQNLPLREVAGKHRAPVGVAQ